MPALTNPKIELFLKLIVEQGLPKEIAYVEAGWKAKTDRVALTLSNRLIKKEHVYARYNELLEINKPFNARKRDAKLLQLEIALDKAHSQEEWIQYNALLRTHNQMTGDIAATKSVATVNQTVTHSIAQSSIDMSRRLQTAHQMLNEHKSDHITDAPAKDDSAKPINVKRLQ